MSCPICRREKIKRIHKLCDNLKIMGNNFPESSSYIAMCENCGLIFTDTEATQQDFLSYYQNGAVAPKYQDMFGAEATNEYYQHLYEIIKPYINADSKLLDIAGAWGEFGYFMKGKGYSKFINLDPNEKCIASAKEKGLMTVLADSTDMSEIDADSVDMVIMNHTLEHILDVDNTMKNIDRVLKKDGYLFIEIPDVEGYADEEAAPYNFLTYEHVLHMSLQDMKNLASEYGYEILETQHYYKRVSNYPSIYAVMRKATKKEIEFSDKSKYAMLKYLDKSKACLEEFLVPLRESKEELILWGIGASTTILLDAFEGCNVKSLIDRNPNRQGLGFTINSSKFVIEDPQTVGEGTIVILSIPYFASIKRQIREMGLSNKVVTLK